MNSIWTETTKSPEFNALDGDIKTDVLIVGGGIAGILCAYELQKAGVDYALIESERICGGITKNTTAKITSQHGLIYQDLIK
ncbi:MAG: FAD-dependent oxidoreductase, partial [Candidatus Scatosoma sp.]